MKLKYTFGLIATFLCISFSTVAQKVQHPCLILTKEGSRQIKTKLGTIPLLDNTITDARKQVDQIMVQPLEVPIPKDAGGGYTHEQHKRNYTNMYHAGVLYQLTGEAKYANFVKDMLMEYARMYPTLPLHPVQKSNYRGRLFWQGLNECVWLVNTSQAYDCIYESLSTSDRKFIETNLFKPMVKFIAIDNQRTFENIHNHGTWAVAGVGMISYVMGDKDMVEKSLYGLDKSGKGGFMKQIDQLFSPDGYFEEGPYYQRYSLQPFITFAQAIDNNEPQRKIFEFKDGVLLKAVTTLLQMTETNGQFFHFNDALDKTWETIELVWGVDIAYQKTGNKQLLSIARLQDMVVMSDAGCKVAEDIDKAEPFVHQTLIVRDGPKGDRGGLGILRSVTDTDESCVVLKYTSQGMGHGHFDKLSFTYYDNGNEIIQDYGAARFLNIEPKNGGHYLKENNTFAKQTISHNTLVVDGQTHFGFNLEEASKHAPEYYSFVNTDRVKMVSAKEYNANPGVTMQRTMFLLSLPTFSHPLVVDIMRVNSTDKHQYDLPFYFKGHLMNTSYPYKAFTTNRHLLGETNGYQHLWVEAKGKSENNMAATTWLNGNRFYTLTTLADTESELFLNRIGGTDPDFNLRNEPCFMIREKNADDHTFVSTIEAHGDYNPRMEYTLDPHSTVKSVSLAVNSKDYTVISIRTRDEKTITICLANNDSNPNTKHTTGGYSWAGVYDIK